MRLLLFLFLMGYLCFSDAHVFHVGGDDGWTLKPSESYSHWAQRNRFQINDEIVFKYKKGDDSVLVVGEDDYNKCNKKNPIKTLNDDGYSKFMFQRSGPHFFISGHEQNCEKGQKLIIVVLADHRHLRSPLSSSAPSPSANHTPPPSPTAKTPSHAPPPSHSPSPSPFATQPSSHAPSVHPPSEAKPAPPFPHSPSPAPIAKTPTHAPPVHSPSHSPSPSPSASNGPIHAPLSHSPSPSSKPISPNSPSPAAQIPPPATTPAHAPAVHIPSPSPLSPPPVPVPHHAPPAEAASPDNFANPTVFFPPHHAPAPAPSSASHSGYSFSLTVGFVVLVAMISAGIIA